MSKRSWGGWRALAMLGLGLTLVACGGGGGGSDGPSGVAISLAEGSATVSETAGGFNLRVQLSPAPAEDLSIPFTVVASPDTGGLSLPTSPLIVPAGVSEIDIPIGFLDDDTREGAQTVTVALGAPSGTVLVGNRSFTLTITDDDTGLSDLRFASSAVTRGENQGTVNFSVTVSPAASRVITLPFTLSGSAGAQDATVTASPLTIAVGATGANISVAINNDSLDEPDESLILTLGTPSQGGRLRSPNVSTLTITDDDVGPAPTVRLGSNPPTVAENVGTVMVQVLVASPTTQAISLPYTLGGTAVLADRTAPASPLIIPAGAASAVIPIAVVDDSEDENDETIILSLGTPTGPTGVQLGTPSTYTLTVTDNDTATPTLRFSAVPQQPVAESAGAIMLEVRISPVATQALTVPVTVSGTAAAADRTVTPSTLSIPAGEDSAMIAVTIVNDTEDEADETVILTLGTPAPAGVAAIGTPGMASLTIADDDSPQPTVSLSAAPASAVEGASNVTLTVSVTPAASQAITVPVNVTGTSVAGDRSITTALPLVIPANATSAQIRFNVTDDTEDENDETVIFTLGTPTGAPGVRLGTPISRTLTLTDNDSGPSVVQFAITSLTVSEGPGTKDVLVNVNVNPAPTQTLTVDFSFGGTADGDDRVVSLNPLTFPPGLASRPILIRVFDNNPDDEPDQTVTLTLLAPTPASAAVLGTNTMFTLTITDQALAQPTLSFAAAQQTVPESTANASIGLVLSPASATVVTVPYTLSGSATNGTDFSIAPASPLTIPAGTTNPSLTVSLVNDALTETDETVIVTLGAPTGASLGATDEHMLIIDDDEGQAAPQGTLFAITDGYRLLRFQASSPGTGVTAVDVTGVMDLPAPDNFRPTPIALEFQPSSGALFLYTEDRRFYLLDPVSGQATLIGTAAVGTADITGIDFNPCPDLIRAVGSDDDNIRLRPDGTLVMTDPDLAYAAGDPNAGQDPGVSALAYTSCAGGATTAFAIDSVGDRLVRLGSENGAPISPNSGQLFTIGDLAVSVGGASQVPFDIDVVSGFGYITDTDNTNSTLYRVNLLSGAATPLGLIDDPDDNEPAVRVMGLAVQP